MINKENLVNETPEELEKLRYVIEEIIKEISGKRITNQKYQIKYKEVVCPKCKCQNNIVKNGHKNGTQRYKCKNCNNFFSITTNTILSHTKLNYTQLKTYIKCLINLKTIKETAKEVGISETETYNIRLKIIGILNNYTKEKKLKEVVQADEKYIRISFKGTRKNKMPRKSRKNGFSDRLMGINNEQVCIIMAIDSYDNVIIKIGGNGPVKTEYVSKVLDGMIEENSILVTNSKTAYQKFAKKNKLKLIAIPSKKRITKDGYHLGELNSLMSELELYIQRFRGLSTRHLQEYLDLFKFKKILKYTIEYMEQAEKTLTFSVTQNSNLINKKIHKIKMPIDILNIFGNDFK